MKKTYKNKINIILVGFFSLFLFGCASNPVTGVCKSCRPYFVRGSWHYPQKHYDYEEVGLASWYGPGFHGKPKPHGEPYNQYEMTAAHKTLPIPTIAEVENLKTGKKIRVLIDDRGPFVYKGRIIDLSVAAAKELGTHKKGTAKVRVRALPEQSDRFARYLARFRRAKDPSGRRWVQVYRQDVAKKRSALHSIHYQKLKSNKTLPPKKQTYLVKHTPVKAKKNRLHTMQPRIQKVKSTQKRTFPKAQKVVLKRPVKKNSKLESLVNAASSKKKKGTRPSKRRYYNHKNRRKK